MCKVYSGSGLKQVFGNNFEVLILYYFTHLFFNKLLYFIILSEMCSVIVGLLLNLECFLG